MAAANHTYIVCFVRKQCRKEEENSEISGIKRSREEDRQVEAEAMANCALTLLSRLNNNATSTDRDYHNDFECKTCNKRFPSFQALGNHRASHKRPKLLAGAGDFLVQSKKNKMHECYICGMEFYLGQALGGHMIRHQKTSSSVARKTKTQVTGIIFCCLDLNLTPDENVELKLWPTAPVSSPVL
ncbi:zinc finger protein ZAT12-like [Nicotiana tabacum]|uniref:Zinc finger protein ZAT12-like n=1 Tax=Nicotiana tabacum TaxID=4097 RepID=A0AC58RXF4_TOBAC|nr:zinc finger protein ZAT12-like [Nicotiana tomentosiformis]